MIGSQELKRKDIQIDLDGSYQTGSSRENLDLDSSNYSSFEPSQVQTSEQESNSSTTGKYKPP